MPRCTIQLRRGIRMSARAWQPLGIADNTAADMTDRIAVGNFLRAIYDCLLKPWLKLGRRSSTLLRPYGVVQLFQVHIFNRLGHLPARVLAFETDLWELVYHLFYLLRFMRFADPAWEEPLAIPLPEPPILLAPGVHFPALDVPAGFPGEGPTESGFPAGWPLPPPFPAPNAPSSDAHSANIAPASSLPPPSTPIFLPGSIPPIPGSSDPCLALSHSTIIHTAGDSSLDLLNSNVDLRFAHDSLLRSDFHSSLVAVSPEQEHDDDDDEIWLRYTNI
ncbi:hypothetical protein N7535_007282 [Penicillium sp. DV-2018c]|nr:hypothetical protein N7461_003309 [Penicillium sp. DV-2018c]KAJ5565644.1 hypothetical protein N7535_007282 [Penicillium sp. DV-2018c]